MQREALLAAANAERSTASRNGRVLAHAKRQRRSHPIGRTSAPWRHLNARPHPQRCRPAWPAVHSTGQRSLKALLASTAKAMLGFGLSVFVALSVVAYRSASAPDRNVHEFPTQSSALSFQLLIWAPALLALALLGFAIGLVPLLLLRAPVRWPSATGAVAGLFWVALAVAGVPYSLGLTAPAGTLIVSIFLAVFVSAMSIGVALSKGSIGGAV